MRVRASERELVSRIVVFIHQGSNFGYQILLIDHVTQFSGLQELVTLQHTIINRPVEKWLQFRKVPRQLSIIGVSGAAERLLQQLPEFALGDISRIAESPAKVISCIELVHGLNRIEPTFFLQKLQFRDALLFGLL